MTLLLRVGGRFRSRRLPPAFWRAYAQCAMVADMPEHGLFAEGNLKREHAALTAVDRVVLRQARTLTQRAVAGRDYAPGKFWSGERTASGMLYSSDACGLALPIGKQWKWLFYPLHNDTCAVAVALGPFRGRTAEVTPHLLLMVQPKQSGESLDQFARIRTGGVRLTAVTPPACPVARCRGYAESQPGYYQPEGGGYGLITVFAWRGPKYPGLAFETPRMPPQGKSPKVQYFRLARHLGRMAPTLYGFVLLDTAISVRTQAIAAERAFFAGLRLDAAAAASASRPTPPPGS